MANRRDHIRAALKVQPNPDNRPGENPRKVKRKDPFARIKRKQTPAAALKAMDDIQQKALRKATHG